MKISTGVISILNRPAYSSRFFLGEEKNGVCQPGFSFRRLSFDDAVVAYNDGNVKDIVIIELTDSLTQFLYWLKTV